MASKRSRELKYAKDDEVDDDQDERVGQTYGEAGFYLSRTIEHIRSLGSCPVSHLSTDPFYDIGLRIATSRNLVARNQDNHVYVPEQV